MKSDNMEEISIYIHIPFCERKCNYCAFASFSASQNLIDEYVDILCEEIKERKTNKKVKTIYIGGGTPSILNENQIEKICKTIFENFDVCKDVEFTIEANPNSLTEDLLKKWKSLGVCRVSLGVQSLNDESLKKIGRLHDKKTAFEKISLTKKYFENVSADLIVGLENETGEDLCEYAKSLLNTGVKHISCYLLEVYEDTKMGAMVKNGEYVPLDDEKMIEAFNKLSIFLLENGMKRYEISNFAFEGFESRHNLNYWTRGEYLGFGLGAHSFVDGERSFNASTFDGYKNHKSQTEILKKKEQIEEIVMLGLRCEIGVNLQSLLTLGYDIKKNAYYDLYIFQNILKEIDGRIYLNPKFYHVSNTIITNLLP